MEGSGVPMVGGRFIGPQFSSQKIDSLNVDPDCRCKSPENLISFTSCKKSSSPDTPVFRDRVADDYSFPMGEGQLCPMS